MQTNSKIKTSINSNYSLSHPLIVVCAIERYSDNEQLENFATAARNDYFNIIEAFHFVGGYSLVYLDQMNQLKHLTKKSKHGNIPNNFKLEWIDSDIDEFNKNIAKIASQDEYDSLIYLISCHGDESNIIFCSDGEEYSLLSLYQQFDNCKCRPFRNKPKIFIIDCNRGKKEEKIFYNKSSNQSTFFKNLSMQNETNIAMDSQTKAPNTFVDDEKNFNSNNWNNTQIINSKTYVPCADFVKLYSCVNGYNSLRHNKNGGYLIQSVTKLMVMIKQLSISINLNDFASKLRILMNILIDDNETSCNSKKCTCTQVLEEVSTITTNVCLSNEDSPNSIDDSQTNIKLLRKLICFYLQL